MYNILTKLKERPAWLRVIGGAVGGAMILLGIIIVAADIVPNDPMWLKLSAAIGKGFAFVLIKSIGFILMVIAFEVASFIVGEEE